MQKNWLFRRLPLLALLCLLLGLTACGGAEHTQPPAGDPTQDQEEPASPAETLASLCGGDYQRYIADTITMQMGNRMDKTPDVVYFPIENGKLLTDYVTIDETTAFEINEKGHIVLTFPAGAVTDEANGEQSFIIPLPGKAPEAETLADYCGADYQAFLTDTITMQMENRMVKTPDVVYFPIENDKPLTDYAAIDGTTAFEVDGEGYLVIRFPSGSVTDEVHGEQTFRVLNVTEK